MENLTQRWTESLKSGQFFWFSKKGRGGLPPCHPLVSRLPLKRKLAWHSAEVGDVLVAVSKSDGTISLRDFFSKFMKNKRDLPKV